MSDDSNASTFRRRKRKMVHLEDSSSDSSVQSSARRRRRTAYIEESHSESDSDANGDVSDSDGSEVVVAKKRIPKVSSSEDESDSSEYESDWSTVSEGEESIQGVSKEMTAVDDAGHSSDASDGQSEKCPICLLAFKQQEVGSPESCDHSFCVDCIQEWSKNVNTCPVDRHTFNLILVRRHYNGKIVRQIVVEKPQQQPRLEDTFEDPTYCEICGTCDREDRMLLCDGCDLGYHLECLEPPLVEVPLGIWYCPDCGPHAALNDPLVDIYDVQLLVEDAEALGWSHHQNVPRLLPRTRHSERVRARIITHRNQNVQNAPNDADGATAPADILNEAGPSTSRSSSNSTEHRSTTKKWHKLQKKQRKSKPRTKITYKLDEATGEKIAVKTTVRRKLRKLRRKQKRRLAVVKQPKSVKERLALKLGMCAPRTVGQSLPDVRVQTHSNSIGVQRHQAGIPVLNLFGQQNQLDYFSDYDSEPDIGSGVNLLIARRPTISDAMAYRRAARRKANAVSSSVTSTTTTTTAASLDVLGSILESQAKFHSKNNILSLNKDGSIRVDANRNNNSNGKINLNNCTSKTRQTPMYSDRSTKNTGSPPNGKNSAAGYKSHVANTEKQNTVVTTTTTSASSFTSGGDGREVNEFQTCDQSSTACDLTQKETKKDKNEKERVSLSDENTPQATDTANSDSELDIYSDIETVTTSRGVEDLELRPPPTPPFLSLLVAEEDDGNNSDVDLIIDTEKADTAAPVEPEKVEVTSTVDSQAEAALSGASREAVVDSTCDNSSPYDNRKISSRNKQADDESKNNSVVNEVEDEDSQDGCPNFSIYSSASINLAQNTDLTLQNENLATANQDANALPEETNAIVNDTHSDSENEAKTDDDRQFSIADFGNMTEDISEEERSYTPCLDEKEQAHRDGIEGLETEMISDEERNDFDESHELKTVSDGDALEINAKESELDFTKPEDYEEGEIVDKSKKAEESKKSKVDEPKVEKKPKEKESKSSNKENEHGNKDSSFKKLSKSNKDRNYRDKDKSRDRSKSKEKKDRVEKDNKRERRKEQRHKEIARYSVRSIISERPKKDQFGRDETRKRSVSRSSKSTSPPNRRSESRNRRTLSRDRNRKRRPRSRERRSASRSRSRSYEYRRSRSRVRKRKRSASRDNNKHKSRRKSRDRSKNKKKKSVSRQRSKSPSPRRKRDWERRHSRGWSPSPSRSYTPEAATAATTTTTRRLTPSWTPPRLLEKQPVKPHNLTVILTNDAGKKKKDKKKKVEKKPRENPPVERQKRRKRDRTPPPSKEVFASGDNILVSVSFNKENTEDANKRKQRDVDEVTTKRTRKEKEKRLRDKSPRIRRRRNQDLASMKPVAIIDLDRSPFKEITPSPKDIIILSDSENGEGGDLHVLQKAMCDSSQQVVSPERLNNNYTTTGPKTPPEPQIKFSLNSKQAPLRVINNPLHEPDDAEGDVDPKEELEQRLNEVLHKGPNTPPEPPNSPPSSPDAYDPFDPTKSRSPTPEPQNIQLNSAQSNNSDSNNHENQDSLTVQIPDALKTHSPGTTGADVQAADSQSSVRGNSPDNKSPECSIAVVINQIVQSQVAAFPTISTKPAPISTSSVTTTQTTNQTAPRVTILSSTVLTSNTASSMPQRNQLPNTTKASPVKISPTKPSIVKSTPSKPMTTKNTGKGGKSRKSVNRNQNGNDITEILDFDSPYSPGSSDYEDLFDPPIENTKSSKSQQPSKNTKAPGKIQNTFDNLFGSSPSYNKKKKTLSKKSHTSKGTKQVGVKLDEDNLKILDDLPNSAVEMQVKDKFLKKLNRQERVVEEVKLVLKPHYNKKRISKEEYKDILRRAVPKICHSKSGEINPKKIQNLIEAYVKKLRHSKKVTSSSSINPQKS